MASSWLLDGLATLVGVAVVAWGGFDHVPIGALVVASIVSYVAWGAGLIFNVNANGRLLATHGVSTNLVSKIVHDVVARRRRSTERARRVAAASGYVVLELVKEVPFVVGAIGVVAVSDSLATPSFFAFMIGANAAAATYELAVGLGTNRLLRRSSRRQPGDDASAASIDASAPSMAAWPNGRS